MRFGMRGASASLRAATSELNHAVGRLTDNFTPRYSPLLANS